MSQQKFQGLAIITRSSNAQLKSAQLRTPLKGQASPSPLYGNTRLQSGEPLAIPPPTAIVRVRQRVTDRRGVRVVFSPRAWVTALPPLRRRKTVALPSALFRMSEFATAAPRMRACGLPGYVVEVRSARVGAEMIVVCTAPAKERQGRVGGGETLLVNVRLSGRGLRVDIGDPVELCTQRSCVDCDPSAFVEDDIAVRERVERDVS